MAPQKADGGKINPWERASRVQGVKRFARAGCKVPGSEGVTERNEYGEISGINLWDRNNMILSMVSQFR